MILDKAAGRSKTAIPLGVLDLVPVPSGVTPGRAVRNSIDLAVQAEEFGYARYWFAEHHFNPGVAGTSPAVMMALAGAATRRIRVGSGAVQMGHRTALATVEEFGLLDASFPGRVDLGLGRSAGRPPEPAAVTAAGVPATEGYAPNGLRIPRRFSYTHLLGSPRLAMQKRLLQPPGASPQSYTEQVQQVLELLEGSYTSDEGEVAHVVPGEGANIEVWILGSSGGESATVAGRSGLRFAANYHVSPATVLEAAEAYRAAFRASEHLEQPYLAVSADVVVAEDDRTARRLAAGYAPWVLSIRTGAGAIAFPTAEEAEQCSWTPEQLELVADRLETQFVGSPAHVADQLEQLRDATAADELIITTITHNHDDRVRSYRLLSEEWHRRGALDTIGRQWT
jgi:alkanesulfonate monooxygenase SsuD/methylene tetrahydromethanopterin reductase-like flavin-dependent oxidoreductase (luciferase family)